MIEKIKETIDTNKKDKEVYKEYIKSFYESNKAQELYKNDENLKDIKKEYEKKEEFDDD